jgi:glycosyltransferase involved in cell wall biosynthesis
VKIALVTTFFGTDSFGGDAVYVERLGHALARRGHEVHVIHSAGAFRCVRRGYRARLYEPPPELRIHKIASSARSIAAAVWSHQTGGVGPLRPRLARLLASVPFDVLHLHNVSLLGHAHVFDLIPPGRRPVKLVTAHDYWWICAQSLLWKDGRRVCDRRRCTVCLLRSRRPPQWWRNFEFASRALAQADAVLFPSQSSMTIHAAHGLRHPHMRHLPCFLPDDWNCPAPARPERPYFAAAGRLVPEKGFHELVPLMRQLPHFDLRIAGSGPLARRLQASAPANVQLLGQQPGRAVAALFRGAVAVIVPSLFPETFGYVAAEAMALGTPVIARRRGALPELVEAARGGMLFDSVEELLQQMQAVAADHALRDRLGQAGRDAATDLWAEAPHLDRYLALVAELR